MRSFFILLLLLPFSLVAQKTIALGDKESPNAKLEDLSWIQGHWRGEAFGGQIEEIWSPPLGGSMMGSFKMVMKGKVSFYELMHIQESDRSLLLQIKHFNDDFTGWESRNESVNFALVKLEDNVVYFDGLTFEMISDNEMRVYVVMNEDDGTAEEAAFIYKRYMPN